MLLDASSVSQIDCAPGEASPEPPAAALRIPAYASCIRAMIPDEIADAAVDGDKDTVAAWLDQHPEGINDVVASGSSLLQICAEDREFTVEQLELIHHLISRGADPNLISICDTGSGTTEEASAVHQAAGGKNSPHSQHVLACLLRAGADPNLVIEVNALHRKIRITPFAATIDAFLASNEGEWQLPIVVRLLRAGASLDNCSDGHTADEMMANEEREWPQLAGDDVYFQAAKTLIRGVRAAGSWKKYCRARAPHREILALRSLAMRGYITPYQRRRTRGAEHKTAIAFVARLGDNGIVWNILSFWRDPDDVEAITLDNGDVVRVYE